MPDSVAYPDLGAVVHPEDVPDGVLDELPSLYGSLFSTLDWFEAYDETQPDGCCLLADPRHVVAFTVAGDTVEVLNKAFAIAPADAGRLAEALFRAFPAARRIHLEVTFPPGDLRPPHRVLFSAEHYVVDLPDTIEKYDAGLGKRTRGNLRNFQNRLRREHPDVATERFVVGDRAEELFGLFLRWKQERFERLGKSVFWEEDEAHARHFRALVRRAGRAQLTTIGGEPAAIKFYFRVGDWFYLAQSAFDEAYAPCRIGFVTAYWLIQEAVARGAAGLSFFWTPNEYKSHLGAHPMTATRVSVFRSQLDRLRFLDEGREAARLRLDGHRATYWRLRSGAGRALRKTAERFPGRRRSG